MDFSGQFQGSELVLFVYGRVAHIRFGYNASDFVSNLPSDSFRDAMPFKKRFRSSYAPARAAFAERWTGMKSFIQIIRQYGHRWVFRRVEDDLIGDIGEFCCMAKGFSRVKAFQCRVLWLPRWNVQLLAC